jgi:hypothetical protein
MAKSIESPRRLEQRRRRSIVRFARIRGELDEAMERRSRLWHEPVRGQTAPPELGSLERRIERLWRELREARAEALSAPRDELVREARTEERVYRELRRRLER